MRRLTLALILISITLFGLMPTPAQALTYDALIIAAGPELYYRFGEPSGAVAVDQMYGQSATYFGPITYGATGAITYDSDTAIAFGTTGLGVHLPYYQAAGHSFAFEYWAKFASGSSSGAQKYIFKMQTVSPAETYDYHLQNFSGSVKLSKVRNGVTTTFNTAISVNVWHHFINQFNYNSGQSEVYLDGALIGSVSDSAFANINPDIYLGSSSATSTLYLDEFAIYNRVLTYAEINQHYAAGSVAITTPTPTITYTPSVTFTPSNTPTPTVTPTLTPGWDYEIPLPSGRTAAVRMEATAGDITVVMFIVFAVAIMLLTVYLRRRSNGS